MHRLSRYRPPVYDKNAGFIIVLLALLFFGAMYAILTRIDNGYAGFIMLIAASGFIAYWTIHLRRIFKVEEVKPVMHKMEQHKDWVYDLIKGESEIIFVAEVPGPEEEVNARLVNGILYINGGQNFTKSIPLDVSEDMGIAEFRYRNGILTLKIKKLM
ncbi:MAG: Hsp20/alpha crystallin family protein [Candidatus Nitrosocaldus sp.]